MTMVPDACKCGHPKVEHLKRRGQYRECDILMLDPRVLKDPSNPKYRTGSRLCRCKRFKAAVRRAI